MPQARSWKSAAETFADAAAAEGPGTFAERVTQAIVSLLGAMPGTQEFESAIPDGRARSLARTASAKAAAISSGAALLPGPLGLASLLPDLISVYKVQAQMVSDIAAVYGKSPLLNKELMVYCLFKHGGAHLLEDLVSRVGERFLIRRSSLRFLQAVVSKVGYRLTQRVMGKALARWVPIVGAGAVGYYAYRDTRKVAQTAIELFSREIIAQGAAGAELDIVEDVTPHPPRGKLGRVV